MHEDQFTAVGPPFAGSGVPRSGSSTKAAGMVYGANRVTASKWWAHAVARPDANRTSKASAYTGAATRLGYSARPLASIPGAVIVLRFSGLRGYRGGKVNCRVRLSHQGIGVLRSA